ncbi:MAG: tRNA lysidine(34) synthetase TilS, partial [Solirubrobacterales bacterium]
MESEPRPDPDPLLERLCGAELPPPERSLVVLLSGGRDSVCMLDLAVRSRAAPALVRAVHVNYGLRDDAVEDERFCAELCEALGVELTVSRPRRPEGPGNLQAWARDARYEAAARVALPADAWIVTGHTADDQVETILYRLASSPSRRALLGMRPRDGILARPLLGTTREQVTEYCRRRGLSWREDATNAEPAFARNRIRAGLLPELARAHPAAAANVLRTAELLREEAEVLDALIAAELAGGNGAGRGRIRLERLRELHPALR